MSYSRSLFGCSNDHRGGRRVWEEMLSESVGSLFSRLHTVILMQEKIIYLIGLAFHKLEDWKRKTIVERKGNLSSIREIQRWYNWK